MSDSPFKFLRAGPPPPKVSLLPDALFFTRAIPVAADLPAAEVTAQVELALESLAPFPVAQLYHGYYHPPGASAALVFAAYRRRFTGEQTELWTEADLVLPTFASLLGAPLAPGTTLLLTHAESLTAIHAAPDGPAQIFTTPLAPATDDLPANEAALTAAKAELIRAVGGSTTVVDLATLPIAQPVASDGEFTFVAGDLVSTIPAATAAAIDVRDKDDLLARRRAHTRDLLFWRVAVGCVLALALLGVGEIGLGLARGLWQKTRLTQLDAQKPTVEKIMNAQALATRIEDLSTKRLLPMEMISLVAGKIPGNIRFTRVVTDAKDLDRVTIDARTDNSGEIPLFKSALEAIPEVAHVEIINQRGAQTTTFTLTTTFKTGAVKPAAAP
ncbi:MAG: hypothetical protein H7343_00770 [Undibacterium sp.]|nr:hypothetical protein [Opitutaceae bacterium]